MTRKDYVSIAADIAAVKERAELSHEGVEIRDAIALSLADTFAMENPRFDRARFLQACGVAS